MENVIVNKEMLEKYGVEAHYLRVACIKCRNAGRKNEWGVTVINGKIDPASLVCKICSNEHTDNKN